MTPYKAPERAGCPPLTRYGVANPYYVISRYLRPESVVYSIGIGNDFSFDEDIVSAVGARTVAVDPTPQSRRAFEALHNPRISFVNCAIGPEDGEGRFNVVKEKKNYLSVHLSERSQSEESGEGEVAFPIRSVHSLMHEFGHATIDLLRLDAEGAEFTVIPAIFGLGIFPTQVIYEIHPALLPKIPGIAADLADASALNGLMIRYGYSPIHISRRGTEISWCRSHLIERPGRARPVAITATKIEERPMPVSAIPAATAPKPSDPAASATKDAADALRTALADCPRESGELLAAVDKIRQAGTVPGEALSELITAAIRHAERAAATGQLTREMSEDHADLLVEVMRTRPLRKDLCHSFKDCLADPAAAEKAAQAFKTFGVVVLNGAMDRDDASGLHKGFRDFVEAETKDIFSGTYLERDSFVVDSKSRLKGYRAKAEFPKTVINVRGGKDAGLLDFFNLQHRFPEEAAKLTSIMQSGLVSRVISALFERFDYQNLNVYYNDNVTETRGFHFDSYEPKVKVFTYLTDVTALDDGPYCFALKSHAMRGVRRRNRKAAPMVQVKDTDAIYIPSRSVTALPAAPGDMIISCQHAAHRGFPQAEGGHRVMAVQSVAIAP